MRFRVGNFVKHKSGGPIMVVDDAPAWPVQTEPIGCVWVEDGQTKAAQFHPAVLQAVYGDGSPRNYDDEK